MHASPFIIYNQIVYPSVFIYIYIQSHLQMRILFFQLPMHEYIYIYTCTHIYVHTYVYIYIYVFEGYRHPTLHFARHIRTYVYNIYTYICMVHESTSMQRCNLNQVSTWASLSCRIQLRFEHGTQATISSLGILSSFGQQLGTSHGYDIFG